MKTLSSSSLKKYASQHPSVRSLNQVAVWAWIAAAVVFVIAMLVLLWPEKMATVSIVVPDLSDQLLPSNLDK